MCCTIVGSEVKHILAWINVLVHNILTARAKLLTQISGPFDIGRNCCSCKGLSVIKDIYGDGQAAAALAQKACKGRGAATEKRAQVVYGQVNRGDCLCGFEQREDGKSGGGIYQRGYRAAVHETVILFQLISHVQVKSGRAALNLSQLKPYQMSEGNMLEGLLHAPSLLLCQLGIFQER
jgi:hypothetical protein